MRILILNGSPHPNGNTAGMVEAFAQGAREAGHTVTVIPVARRRIAGCLGCEYCHERGGGNCIQKDDMEQIYTELRDTQMLVLAAPVYFYAMSGQLQMALNRLYAPHLRMLERSALLLSAGDQNAFEPSVMQYRRIFQYYGVRDACIFTLAGAQNRDPQELEKLRQFARSL